MIRGHLSYMLMEEMTGEVPTRRGCQRKRNWAQDGCKTCQIQEKRERERVADTSTVGNFSNSRL
jgi:hypothetical protein